MSSGGGDNRHQPQPQQQNQKQQQQQQVQADSVGSLLAAVADRTAEGLRILGFSDKRQWGPDEHEQVRALEELLDEARKDFQELSPLLNGQFNYEHDRTHESILELRALRDRFLALTQTLKDWSRIGGPIDPTWTRDTQKLQRDLHRAQYRAAGRIFRSGQVSSPTTRCLGAFLVHRRQRALSSRQLASVEEGEYQRRFLEERRVCSQVGGFLRLGDAGDIAFVCDFCDGHLVWEDLERMPSVRTCHEDATWAPSQPVAAPGSNGSSNPSWQALGFSQSKHEEKQVVFGPVAIANHIAPLPGDWMARITCPFCEEMADEGPRYTYDEEELWRPDATFDDVAAFQEHLEWQHTQAPTTPGTWSNAAQNCTLM